MSDHPTTEAAAPVYEDVAGLLEYPLVRSEISEEQVAQGIESARQLRVASVIVRPCDLDLVGRWIAGAATRLGTLVDTPHGYSNTSSKLYAARDLLRRGAQEIDTVLNTGKLVSRQFQYLEMEMLQMAESCRQSGAILKVNIESEFLNDELKILACRIARRAEADYIATNRPEDLALLKEHSRGRLKIKFQPAAADLDTVLAWREAGVTRIQVADPAAILESWKARLAAHAGAAQS